MSESTVTSKGQITIPADIRKALGLTTQDRVVFTPLQDGTVVMRAKTRSMVDLKGLLKRPRGSAKVAIDDMNIGRD
ncbi:type II toxin-antitoxin system PrlF family antitoxin [Aquabacterium sp.]|uniref:AbrB/MazE/SpoVT family DNA-binding domain-containing protein n=1 Tax=Aquabacterium sp. TaxID=1872578 RepID=UPI00198A0DB8|nr:type II toxin-antitoxin system PrlF family antitoxin [Aquabacterium sp.]MBC7701798.1 type II toxin-antitoxin system PrlF family antitoxin [Aquabacterium sp.]